MLTCVYGSSEYAQGFSRVGSLFGSVFIVNDEVQLNKCNYEKTPDGIKFSSLDFNYNDTPVTPKKGIIVGSEYQTWMLQQL